MVQFKPNIINYKFISMFMVAVIPKLISGVFNFRMKSQINEALSYLKEADALMESGSYIDVVLIIGKNSVGKSALGALLGTDSENLLAREIQDGNETKIVIENLNPTFHRRQNSNLQKKTIFPELIYNSATDIAYYDCSGFSDGLNTTIDVIFLHFMRKILLRSENIKLIYVFDYEMLKKEDRLSYLANSFKFIGSFVNDMQKYKESISFVITESNNDVQSKNDDSVIKSIINLIPQAKEELIDASSNQIDNSTNSTEQALELSDVIDSNRIAILHWPNEVGPLSDNKRIQEDKLKLLNMINATVFTSRAYNDFSYTILNISYGTLIPNIVSVIQERICRNIYILASRTVLEYKKKEKDFKDLRGLQEEFIEINDLYTIWIKNLTESKSTERLLLSTTEFLNATYVPNSDKIVFSLFRYHDFLNFIRILNSGKLKLKRFDCFDLPESTTYFNESELIHTFLYNTYLKLGEWHIQNNKDKFTYDDLKTKLNQRSLEHDDFYTEGVKGIIFKDIIERIYDSDADIVNEDYIDLDYDYFDKDNLTNSNSTLNSTNLYNNYTNENVLIEVSAETLEQIYNATFNEEKISIFLEILDLGLDRVNRINCIADNHISAKGDYIKLSEVVGTKICPEPLATIEIFGVCKVFIDMDFIQMGQGIKMSIIAPIWEVLKRTKIILQGRHGAVHNQSKAQNGPNGTFGGESGSNAEHGLPGRRGLSGGTFIGIADKIINGMKLTISSIGGDGSDGQDGGDAAHGMTGLAMSLIAWVTEKSIECRVAGVWYHTTYDQRKDTNNGGHGGNGGDGGKFGFGGLPSPVLLLEFSRNTSVTVNRIRGKDGKDGIAGIKGIGAWSGNQCTRRHRIYPSPWNNRDYRYHCTKQKAADGIDGKTGANVKGREEQEQSIVWDFSGVINEYKGVIIDNLNQHIKFSHLIDFYDSLDTDPEINDIWTTLSFTVELNEIESRFYRLKDQIDFLPFYENYYERLENYTADKDSKLEKEKTVISEKEQRKILGYLHTACLSKICSFSDDDDSSLIINSKEYMEYVIGNIKRLENIQNKVAILEINEEHKKDIDSKIDKGYDMIDNTISVEMDKIQSTFEGKLFGLLDEITTIQKDHETEIKRLTRMKAELEKNLLLTCVLEGLKFITETILTLTGVGKAVVGVVDQVFNVVEDHVLMDSNEDLKLNPVISGEMSQTIKDSDKSIESLFTGAAKILNDQIKRLEDEEIQYRPNGLIVRLKKIRDDSSKSDDQKLDQGHKEIDKEIQQIEKEEKEGKKNNELDSKTNTTGNHTETDKDKVEAKSNADNHTETANANSDPKVNTGTQTESDKDQAKTNAGNQDQIPKAKKKKRRTSIWQRLKSYWKKKFTKPDSTAISSTKNALEKGHEQNNKIKNEIKNGPEDTKTKIHNFFFGTQKRDKKKALQDARAAMTVASKLGTGAYNKIVASNKQIAMVDAAIEDRQHELADISNFKEKIKQDLMPAMKGMIGNLKENAKNMGTKSAVELDWAQYVIHDKINDIKRNLQAFTKGFQVSEEILLQIDRLSQVMDTLISTFQRIQSYNDQKTLGDYITNVASVGSSNIKIYDEFLNKAVLKLDLTIKSNIVLMNYNSAIDGLRQYVFPFADYYFKEFQLPDNIVVEDSVEDLVDKAVTQLQILQLKLMKTSAILFRKHDQYLQEAEFGYDDEDLLGSEDPFFVWQNAEHYSSIFSLLSGNSISLNSDVQRSQYSAIKFNRIELKFKATTKEKQILVDKMLSDFLINITHMGTSNYRCNSKFYVISHQSETIMYSYAKNNDDQPKRTNHIYNKLKNNDFMLSPYGMWSVNLIQLRKRTNFTKLRELANFVTLELAGYAQFIDLEAEVCDTQLTEYYTEDTTIQSVTFYERLIMCLGLKVSLLLD